MICAFERAFVKSVSAHFIVKPAKIRCASIQEMLLSPFLSYDKMLLK